MSKSSAPSRDLLFGLLAMQTGLIDEGALFAAFGAWSRDKSACVADHLVALGHLNAPRRAAAEGIAGLHVQALGGDPETSLGALSVTRSIREKLAQAGGSEIEATLEHVRSTQGPTHTDDDVDRTGSHSLGEATSDGQRFRILRPHAKGGLGAVFVALDTELHREVALKQILEKHADDAVSRERFVAEAEITGALEHPGVVPVYGLGTDASGRPYYAMRFVKGHSLKEAINRFHNDEALKKDPGRRSLELRELQRRFTDICNAIDYAHSRGVIHRDLKPSNIIVGEHGETLVVDWGLAKTVGRPDPSVGEQTIAPSWGGSPETLPGSALGTPAYMSPEQARGELNRLGPRSDVYSLGATLYCLLTGRAPFEGDDIGAVLHAVRTGQFQRPSQLDPALDKALEAVCLKAMATDPEDRYATPRALADDLGRWMADEPVLAWREPLARRARRWARRNRAAVTAGAGALVAGVIGMAAVLTVQTLAKADLAESLTRETTAKKALAETNAKLTRSQAAVEARYDLAVTAIRTFHTGVSQDFLLKQGQFKELRDRLMRSASDYYGKLGALLARENDVASRRALLASNFDLALLNAGLGRTEEALAVHREVLASRKALAAAARSDPGLTVDVGRSLIEIASLLEAKGKNAEAMAALRRSESLLAGPAGSYPSARASLADCRTRLGGLLVKTGRTDEALSIFRQARADQEVLAADPAADPAARVNARLALANTVNRIGVLLSSIGRPAEAETESRAALALYQKVVEDAPADPAVRSFLAQGHLNLGVLLSGTGRPTEAEAEYRRSLEIVRALAEDYSGVLRFWTRLAQNHNNLATVLAGTGRQPEAETNYRAALAIQRKLAADHPTVAGLRAELAGSHLNLANWLRTAGKSVEAEAELRAALPIQQKLADDHPAVASFRDNLAGSHSNLGSLLSTMGRPADAQAELRQALVIQAKLAKDHPAVAGFGSNLAGSHLSLGLVLSASGLPVDAEAELRAALRIQEKLAAENRSVTEFRHGLGESHYSLGGLLSNLGRQREAEAELRQAMGIFRALCDEVPTATEFPSLLGSCRTRIGVVMRETGLLAAAEAELRAGLAIRRELAQQNPTVPGYRNDVANGETYLADLLRALGRWGEARDGYNRAIASREELLQADRETNRLSDQASSLRRRGLARASLGDPVGAAADARRALALLDGLSSRSGEEWYETACCHAALNGPAEANRAMDRLRRAVGMGYRNFDAFRTEVALDPLRDRADFRLLILDLAMPADPFAPGPVVRKF